MFEQIVIGAYADIGADMHPNIYTVFDANQKYLISYIYVQL